MDEFITFRRAALALVTLVFLGAGCGDDGKPGPGDGEEDAPLDIVETAEADAVETADTAPEGWTCTTMNCAAYDTYCLCSWSCDDGNDYEVRSERRSIICTKNDAVVNTCDNPTGEMVCGNHPECCDFPAGTASP